MPFDLSTSAAGWQAGLALKFRRSGDRTVLAERRHVGPLVVQRQLYPEGGAICHAVLVHPPGGIAGGDRIELQVRLEPEAHAVLTTPAATKWYRTRGPVAQQRVTLELAPDAVLEYLPQEAILFDHAQARSEFRVELGQGARYAGWEIVCLGRRASGERFQHGKYRQALTVRRDEQLLWHEAATLAGSDPLLDSPVGLGGASVFGGMIVAAAAAPANLIEQAREIHPREALRWGITALPGIVSARFLGHSAEAGRDWFEALRGVFRPWYAGCTAIRPRLWNT